MNPTIVTAIRERRLLNLTYGWGHRVVEPHAYGVNNKGNELLRAYQVGGVSQSGKPTGWKLLRVDEITGMRPDERHFSGPRNDYELNDEAMTRQIYAQL